MIEICALCNGYTKIILLGFINNFSLIKYCVDKDVRWLTQMKFTLYTYFQIFNRGRNRSWIYNYLWNQCLWCCEFESRSGRGPPVSSTNKTDRHDMTEILLKVALNTIKQNKTIFKFSIYCNGFLKRKIKHYTIIACT